MIFGKKKPDLNSEIVQKMNESEDTWIIIKLGLRDG